MTSLSLDKLIPSIPAEMLYEIFSNLPFGELLNIFVLNREIYYLLVESEYFFQKLCTIYCKIYDIDPNDYGMAVHRAKERKEHVNLYYSVMMELISCYGYSWDTKFSYFRTPEKYELTSSTLKTIDCPSFGEFYTIKANRLLKPGKFYRWKIRLDDYIVEGVDNSFRIMIGMESLGFFPFSYQTSCDVIGWQTESKGIALIVGTNSGVIRAGLSVLALNGSYEFDHNFASGDIIQIEFDYRHVPLDVKPFKHIGTYSDLPEKEELMGLVRFSVIRNDQETELASIKFGDVRFSPYVPAVSLNKKQTISFVH